jgi:hypothetical protein
MCSQTATLWILHVRRVLLCFQIIHTMWCYAAFWIALCADVHHVALIANMHEQMESFGHS